MSLNFASCSLYEDDIVPSEQFPDTKNILSKTDSTSLNFFIISDWGCSGSNDQKKVESEMNQIAKIVSLKFILTCGDNFQVAGVNSINDSLWYLNFENVYNDSSLRVPWYPDLGNHDYLGNPDAQVEYSSKNKYWNMPARYYTFVKKVNSNISVRFIVLDTPGLISEYKNLTDSTRFDTITQYCWLKELLPLIKEKWIIVTGHHPIFSASLYHGDTKEMKNIIKPLFDGYNVDFYICGHDHNFEYAKEKGKPTDYIVTGTGGYVRPAGHNERTIYSMSSLGFTYISISQDSAKLYFITSEGEIGYSYIKKK